MTSTQTISTTDAQHAVSAPIRPEDALTRHEPVPSVTSASRWLSPALAPVARASVPTRPGAAPVGLVDPRQEWCDLCSYDETSEPGVPREIVDHSFENDPAWDDAWGRGPQYEIWHLTCGHTVAILC
ncbi:hypothetical protein C8K30_1011073 [Promicromonospora sp. AC04]|uniref:hypothetical protein n=1 Tax=Promicromonospora sp. AC04 TaxID=2135723 RepID=UPI000D39B700|nr:hypothetical protein [Promicromonospora sp. AC04]PUB32547.1 hypothetical protein C8K30_1011073 [Promicromonospora sp. AC04]